MLVYRENTEGEYAPVGGQLTPARADEVAIQTARLHPPRLRAHHAGRVRAARKRPRKKLT